MTDFGKAFIAIILARYLTSENCKRKTIENNVCNELDRAILERRYIDGVTFEELAEEFGYSLNGIKKRVYKYKRLFAK